ncbi:OmpP1/FadL family transporter [Acinetobacter zhairhuonensis]|uniref:OmpP1/FadL family transporter n=1 Tax=Acinetobacter sp. A7.4 TaxID=2919921 RepID=UPI001F4DE83A|nr:outer membrane protein transport protein [Acinetobacter sp. A7.4]MCJ8160129.1 outer membrane protein transport protein [Acinetobacter sp. A7.4]
MWVIRTFTSMVIFIPPTLQAGGMDLSGQSIWSFYESGNYAELTVAHLNADISGQVQNQAELAEIGVADFSTGNFVEDRDFVQAALKFQPHPKVSVGLIFDQPFGIDIQYHYHPNTVIGPIEIEATEIDFDSHNITSLVGYQLNPAWQIYAGLALQSFEGDLQVFGQSFSFLNGYRAEFEQDYAFGWLTGFSYQIPEYALRTSLTYRSAIKHQVHVNEYIQNHPINFTTADKTTIETPTSINLDFQTGLSQNNLLYASLRWVNWSDYVIQPTQFAAIIASAAQYAPEMHSYKMIQYQKDQWSGKIGIAHQISPRWVSTLDVNWDSGNGNIASTLSPVDGFYGLGLGALYYWQPQSFFAFGTQYLRFNKAKTVQDAEAESKIATLYAVNQNDAWVFGGKIGHHF